MASEPSTDRPHLVELPEPPGGLDEPDRPDEGDELAAPRPSDHPEPKRG